MTTEINRGHKGRKKEVSAQGKTFLTCGEGGQWVLVVVVLVPEPVPVLIQRELIGQQAGEGGAQDPSPEGGLRHPPGKQVNVVWTPDSK